MGGSEDIYADFRLGSDKKEILGNGMDKKASQKQKNTKKVNIFFEKVLKFLYIV